MLYIYAYVLLLDTPTQERREGGGGGSQGNCPGARAPLGARDYNPKWKLPITRV